ncbi:hypothetical protein [Pseudomonas rhodesiae]|uniref:hypothetical protein n=1 Tax=Pseudomonas rhodesiae TaxID=76760 RepID=UPI0028D88FA0|nr:hypothetical protein [Pseudomonas rhodesiae]
MFAIKLTLILLVALLYLVASGCWIFWIGPDLVFTGTTEALLYAFGGTCAWLLTSFGLIIHVIKTARPTAVVGKEK